MNFLQTFKSSFYNPGFYKSAKDEKFSVAFKYILSLVSLMSVAVAFVVGVYIAPEFSKENLRKLVDFYPSELNIDIKNGNVSTSVTEPYFIKDKSGISVKGRIHSNVLVIDTKKDFSLDGFKNYDTEILLGKNYVVMSKNDGRLEFLDLSRMPNFSINQTKIYGWIDYIAGYHWLFSIAIFFFAFIAFFVGFTLQVLLILLITSLVALVTAKIAKVPYTFKNFYIAGLYAVTPASVLYGLGAISGLGTSKSTFFVITLLVLYLNFKQPNEHLPIANQ
jgi:hypothetical protein